MLRSWQTGKWKRSQAILTTRRFWLVRWSLLLTPLQRLLAAEQIAGMLPGNRTRDRRRELKLLRVTLDEIRRRKAAGERTMSPGSDRFSVN
jgi:hypothetical protein